MGNINVDTLETDSAGLPKENEYTKISSVSKGRFCEDMYYYQGGFADGSYLIPYAREANYDKRKEHRYLRNYYQKLVDSGINDVYNEAIQRQIDNATLEAFIENPMQNGVSFNEMMAYSSLFEINNGFICTIVDNFPDIGEMSEAELIESGLLPYVYFRKPDTIEDYETDKFGLLTSITFAEGKKIINGVEKDYFKTWNDEVWRTFYKDGESEVTIDEQVHGLSKFPVNITYMGKKRNPTDFEADPRFYALAVLNFALFNLDSECRDNILSNLFPILTGSGFGSLTALEVGAHGLLDVPAEEKDPQFIEPTAATFSEGREAKKELVESFLQLAEQMGVSGVEKSSSGVAKAFDFFASSTLKKEISLKAKQLDQWIIGQVADYLNIKAFDYNPNYPVTFMPNESDLFTERLEKLDMIGIPKEMKDWYLTKIAEQDMTGEPSDTIEDVTEAIQGEPEELPPE